MDVGVNLDSVTYWGTEEPFIDRFHTAGAWVARDTAGNDVSASLALDSHGDPSDLTNISSLSVAVGVDPRSAAPIDEYILTFDGTAGRVSIANAKVISQTDGKIVFDYTGGDTKPDVYITFSKLNSSDPLGDIHLVRSDQQDLYHAGEIFNPDFVAKVAQWNVVRFMDWGTTNDFADVSWSTRTTLDSASWAKQTAHTGVPIEAMVQLANEAHVDIWYNVPTKADDTYVRNALTYIRDHLDPDLKVNVEWSNEVWNTSFAANGYATSQANALWGTTDHAANVYYGYRSAQIASVAQQVFTGDHASQLVEVLAGQAAGSGLVNYMLQGIAKAGVGTVADLFDDYAIAPYFGSEMGTSVKAADEATVLGWAKSGSAGLDAAFHELEYGKSLTSDFSLAVIHNWLTKSAAVAQANGLNLVAYEGGISLGNVRWDAADKPVIQDFFNRVLADPRMGELYTKMLADFAAAGGTKFVAFNDAATPSEWGSYGMLGSIYDNGSARNDALLAAGNHTDTSAGTDNPALNEDDSATSIGSGSAGLSEAPPTTSGRIDGTAGDDHLFASAENDTIDGAAGNDHISGSSSTVDAFGHMIESDIYMGGAGSDTIDGGEGNDHIYGNELTTVAGSIDGADSLSGGGGMDYLQGNAGNDTIDGGAGNDRVYGGANDDSLLGGDGNDHLQGNRGNDFISGGNGNDVVHGGADNDVVHGDAGNDQLFGDAGNDTLVGGAGIDVLAGGPGSDTFVFNAHDAAFLTTGSSAWATDEITDFSHGLDTIGLDFHPVQVLSGSAASMDAALTLANSLVGAHSGDADVAAVTVGNDTYLFWDAAGQGGTIDSAVKIDHVHDTFTLSDFG